MDSNAGDSKVNPIGDLDAEEEEPLLARGDGDEREKVKRKVQWNDNLAEIIEFLPSDTSDSEDEESEACFCRIM